MNNVAWGSAPDLDVTEAPIARNRIIDELLATDTVGFGIHFGDRPFGRVVRSPTTGIHWEPVDTHVLLPPPRD
jgi:hypothetical protein